METISLPDYSSFKNMKTKWLIIFLVVLFLVYIFFGKDFLINRKATSEYQAVFLENGQVYFGHLKYTDGWIKLTDVYYLQVTDPLQANTEEKNNGATQREQNIQLIKLGSELHGPKDEMFIAKSKVMFWENMKDESKVLQSIKDHKLKNNQL